jgi:tetratricopeptide (TPR) repeat protein
MQSANLHVIRKLLSRFAAPFLLSAALLAQSGTPHNPPRAARRAFNSAEAAEKKERIQEARRNYESAVAIFPDYAEAWCGLGLLQAEHDEFAEAMKSFRQAIRSDPKDICPYLPLAMLEHGAGDWPALLEVTGRMLRLDSIDYPLAHLLNAAAHYNLGENDEAQKAARAAEMLDSKNFPKIWELLGWTDVRKGNDAAAAAEFEKYLEAAPLGSDSDIARARLSRLAARLPNVPKSDQTTPTFRAQTDLALVQFQVTPKKGKLISPLQTEDIEILEDGVPQKTLLFEVGREYPRGMTVEISLLFDCSDSMQTIGAVDPYVFNTSLLDEYENVSVAIYGFTGPADPYLVIENHGWKIIPASDPLGEVLKRFTAPTRNARTLKSAMDAVLTMSPSDTPLFSAIGDAARDAGDKPNGAVRMLVVFSDGLSSSPGSMDLARADFASRTALRYGVSILPVLVDQPLSQFYSTLAPLSVARFQELARQTGGRASIHTATDSVMPEVLKTIAKQVLPYTYAAGYYPSSNDQNKRHEVQVVLRNKSKGDLTGGSRIVIH